MKLLIISDIIVESLYSAQLLERCHNVNLVIGCGDLPYEYIEFIVSMLNVPVYHVRGNHSKSDEYDEIALHTSHHNTKPHGAIDLHRQVIDAGGLLLAGIEGCQRYRNGPFQYSQNQMWLHVFYLLPGMFRNYLRYGRYLDIFVSHAPLAGIHDDDDIAHHGIRAFRWLVKTFQPQYHLHGHVHTYRQDIQTITTLKKTQVINTYGYRLLEIPDIHFNGTTTRGSWPHAKPDQQHRQ